MGLVATQEVHLEGMNHTVEVHTPQGTVSFVLYATSDPSRTVLNIQPSTNAFVGGIVYKNGKKDIAGGFSVIMFTEDDPYVEDEDDLQVGEVFGYIEDDDGIEDESSDTK